MEEANENEEDTKDDLDTARATRASLCFIKKDENPDCMERRMQRVLGYFYSELGEKHASTRATRRDLQSIKPRYKGSASSETFAIPKGNVPFSISRVIDQRKGKNTGKTTLHYHDSGNDNLITIEPGEEVTILSPSGTIIVTNRDMNKNGKLRLVVYTGKEVEKSPSERTFASLVDKSKSLLSRIKKLIKGGFNYNPLDEKITLQALTDFVKEIEAINETVSNALDEYGESNRIRKELYDGEKSGMNMRIQAIKKYLSHLPGGEKNDHYIEFSQAIKGT